LRRRSASVVQVRTEVDLIGNAWQFSLRLTGWQYPEITSGSDANWIAGEVELVRDFRGCFSARHPVHARAEELADFRDQLAALLEHSALSATMVHLESVFGATLGLVDGVGCADVFIRDRRGARLSVTRAFIAARELAVALDQMRGVVATFPVRGDAL
jgi:hypothetical protein